MLQRKTTSKPFAWLMVLFLMVYMLVPTGAYASETAEGLILTLETNKTEIASGEEFSYRINYSASSTVQNFSAPRITFTVPAGVSYTNKSDSSITTSTVTDSVDLPGQKEVTFTFKGGVLPAGSTGQLVVSGKFDNYVTPNGTSATARSVFYATVDGTPVQLQSNDVTVVSKAAANWKIEKQKIRPLPEPFKGANVQYEILFSEVTPGVAGSLDIQNVVVTDKLPDGAVLVSADSGGTAGPDNTVVWNLEDGLRGSKRMTLIVNYPSSLAATEVTNEAVAAFTPLGGTPATLTAEVTHGFSSQPMDTGSGIVKWTDLSTLEISPGQSVTFHLSSLANKANDALDSVVIEDLTPLTTEAGTPINLELQSLKTGTFKGISTYDVYYTQTENPSADDWTLWSTVDASSSTMLDATALGIVKGLQIRIGTVPIDVVQTGLFDLTYKVPADFTVPANQAETVKNIMTMDYVFNGEAKSVSSNGKVDIVADRPMLQLEKSSSKSSLKPTESTTFTLKVTNSATSSSATYDSPVIIDTLPAEFTYLADSWKITKPAGLPLDPKFTAEPQPDGTTKLTWFWDDANPGSLHIGEAVTISFDAELKAGTEQKTLTNKLQVTSPTYLNDVKFSNSKSCVGCTPPDGLYSVYQPVNVQVNEEVSLQSEMWVKGELDSDWSKYPNSGTTAPGGRVMYQLKIRNVGNVPTKNLTILNTFARVGDTSVMNGAVQRSSQWGPLLSGAVVVPDYVKVLYSTGAGITMNPMAGIDNGVWLDAPPQDLTSVTAVKFVFDDSYVIDPLDSMTLEWPMIAPVGSPTGGEIAWNSFAYKMNKANGGSILPAEPLKVGVKVLSSPKAELGDRVWLDQNENGIQDAGEPGVNSVKVELYNEAGSKVSETLTGNDSSGKPGAYLFPNLDAGKYTVLFTPGPTYEGLTKTGQGSDREQDSDASPGTGKSALLTLADGEKNHSVDAGLIPKKGSLGDRVWLDANGNGIQDDGEAGLNGVTVELYDGTDSLLSTTTTSTVNGKDGSYSFTQLQPGTYKIKVKLPSPAYEFTSQKQGADANIDSDVDKNTGTTSLLTLGQAEENLTLDAGLIKLPPGSIGDYVWLDSNRNGLQDPTEEGLNQVNVQLYNDKDQLVSETVTADQAGKSGSYLFDNVDAGTYYVKFILPYPATSKGSGGQPSLDSDVNAGGKTDLVTLHPGDHIDTVDAGVYRGATAPADPPTSEQTSALGQIGYYVWLDANANGLQDVNEQGVNGATVQLYDAERHLLSTVQTHTIAGQAGAYLFDRLPRGEYYVKFTAPDGYLYTAAEVGGNEQSDSNADAAGWTKVIRLGENEVNLTVDAGLLQQKEQVPPNPSTPANPSEDSDPSGTQVPPATPASSEHTGKREGEPAVNGAGSSSSTGNRLLPQTGDQVSALPWIGLGLILLASTLLALRRKRGNDTLLDACTSSS
jgi:serine-aspartate repeat-containing protein C/D/E